MKLPGVTDLDPEQMRVFNAPLTGSVLITGPPGSGKTVIAFYRALALQKSDLPYEFVMYTNVLSQYTRQTYVPGQDVTNGTTTLHSWLSRWWRRCTNTPLPTCNPEDGNRFRLPDYAEMIRRLESPADIGTVDWGHLIIDEGQDFPNLLYAMLRFCREIVFDGWDNRDKPALTILADENQQITPTNSTIAEIREKAGTNNEYFLCKNYRNTRQIALFANSFCVGLQTGEAQPPDRDGELPRIIGVKDRDEVVERISRHAERRGGGRIGVFVRTQKQCRSYYNRLVRRHRKSRSTRVQAFVSCDDSLTADKLDFDIDGSITVLCHASAKGLEFDSVFIPELQTMNPTPGNDELLKSTLYVLCTRARERLWLLFEGERDSFISSGIGRWIPGPSTGLVKWQ